LGCLGVAEEPAEPAASRSRHEGEPSRTRFGGPADAEVPLELVEEALGVPGQEAPSWATGIRHAGLVMAASGLANGANVVVTAAVARLVTPRQYGTLAVLLAAFLVLSLPGSAVVVGVVRRVAALQARGLGQHVGSWGRRLWLRLAVAATAGGLGGLVLAPFAASALSLESAGGVAPVLAAGGAWLVLSVDRGLLQARRRYSGLAANLLVEGGARSVLVLGAAAGGLGVPGIALGLLVAEAAAAAHARLLASRAWPARRSHPRDATASGFRFGAVTGELRRDVTAALASLALIAFLQNADLVVVSRADPAASGRYAAVSVAAKALVFAALALSSYVVPEAALHASRGLAATRQLAIGAGILAVICATLIGIALGAGHWLLVTVFGARLAGAAAALGALVGAMTLLAYSALFATFLLGAGRRSVWLVLTGASGALLGALVTSNHRPVPIAQADLRTQAVVLAAMAGLLAWHIAGGRWRLAPSGDRQRREEAGAPQASLGRVVGASGRARRFPWRRLAPRMGGQGVMAWCATGRSRAPGAPARGARR
jgi:O-antigen/teichoic acid export membrane protein